MLSHYLLQARRSTHKTLLILGVIHKRRPQGGGRGSSKGGRPQKILKKVSKKT